MKRKSCIFKKDPFMTYFMIALEVKYLIEKESELLRKM